MSIESAKAFIDRMKTDEDFAKKVGECKDAAARMAFVSANGYDFIPAEITEAQGELTDEELAGISGGHNYCITVDLFGILIG